LSGSWLLECSHNVLYDGIYLVGGQRGSEWRHAAAAVGY